MGVGEEELAEPCFCYLVLSMLARFIETRGVTVCLSEPHKGWCRLSLTSACYTEQVMAGLPGHLEMSSGLFAHPGARHQQPYPPARTGQGIAPWRLLAGGLEEFGMGEEDEGLLFHSGP